MIFCGQCGLQLAPGSTRCPRCGTAVELADTAMGGDLHVDDATVASRAFIVQNQAPWAPQTSQTPPQLPNNQRPLILRGDSDYGYGMQDANGATSRVEQVNYSTQAPPSQQVMGSSYAGYPAQPRGGYPSTQSGHLVQNTGGYSPQVSHPGFQSPYTEVPGQMGGSYPQYSGQYLPQSRATSTKGRTTGLILVLIGLLLIICAVVLFAMQQGLIV